MQKIIQKIILVTAFAGCLPASCIRSDLPSLSVTNIRSHIIEYERVSKQDRWIRRGALISAISVGCLGLFALGYYARVADNSLPSVTQEEIEASSRKAYALFYEQWLAQQNRSLWGMTYDIFVGNLKNIIGMSVAVSCSLYAREAFNHTVDNLSLWWHDGARQQMYDSLADVGNSVLLVKTFVSGMRLQNKNDVDRQFCIDHAITAYNNLVDALERSLAMLCLGSSQDSKLWLCNQENGIFLAVKALSKSLSSYTKKQSDELYTQVNVALENLNNVFTQTINLHMSQEMAHG